MYGVVEINGKFYVTKNGAVCDDWGWTRREDAEETAKDYAYGEREVDGPCQCEACKDEREHMAASDVARFVRSLTGDETVTRDEAAAVVAWCEDWLADVLSPDEAEEVGIDFGNPADVLHWSNRAVDGGLRFVLADVRGSARIRANQEAWTDHLRPSDLGGCDPSDPADKSRAELRTVAVVFDMESRDTPVPIGTYVNTDEDVVSYIDPAGVIRYAPADCVRIVTVEVR